ncbi:FG-GAP repeat domain-containing protein [Gemmatirosa kalamazoonensis]|nr:VCBS repeat-containing protein [Gemmatirosa kalamazoonensis]
MNRSVVRPRALGAATLLIAAACHDTPVAPPAAPTMPTTSTLQAPASMTPDHLVGDVSARMIAVPGRPRFLTGGLGRDAQLVFENPSNGDHAYWRIRNGAINSTGSYGVVPTSWTIVGGADISNDAIDDIYWQNTPSNGIVAWRLDGSDAISATLAMAVTAPSPWKVSTVADLNKDGSGDLLWRNTTTGDLVVWLMTGGTNLGTSALLSNVPTAWQLAAAGDLDGDGNVDLFWQNTANGARVVWKMTGTNHTSTIDLGVVPTNWTIAAIGDYDDDGHNDIFWQDPTTGVLVIWRMNGTTWLGTVTPGSPPAPWLLKVVRRSGGNTPAPVQVTLQSITTPNAIGLPVAANTSDIHGNITANVTVNTGGYQVDSVRATVSGVRLRCANAISGSAVPVACTLSTSSFNATTGAALALNGARSLVIETFYRPQGGGASQTATLTQPLTLNNTSGVYLAVTTAPSAAQAAVNAFGAATSNTGLLWRAGSVTVSALPVSFGAAVPAGPYTISLQDATGVIAQHTTTASGSAFTTTFSGTTGDAFDLNSGVTSRTLDGYTTPGAGQATLSNLNEIQSGTFVVLGTGASTSGTPVLNSDGTVASLVGNGGVTFVNTLNAPLYIDNQSPQPVAQFGTTGLPAANFSSTGTAYQGLINPAFTFASRLTPMFRSTASNNASALTATNPDYNGVDRISIAFYGGNAPQTATALTTSGTVLTTGAQLPLNSSPTAYNAAVKLTDVLGNSRSQLIAGDIVLGSNGTAVTSSATLTFGVDNSAPSIVAPTAAIARPLTGGARQQR